MKIDSVRSGAESILEIAERLIGSKGAGVSMRQIVQAAGLANPGMVQYHFVDKRGLINAIVASHQEVLERERGALLDRILAEGRTRDTRALFEASVRPVAELKNSHGEHSYLRFIWQLRQPHYIAQPMLLDPHKNNSDLINRYLADSMPHLPSAYFEWRKDNALLLFVNSLVSLEAAGIVRDDDMYSLFIEDALDVAVAALVTPVDPVTQERASQLGLETFPSWTADAV